MTLSSTVSAISVPPQPAARGRRGRWWKVMGIVVLVVGALLGTARLMLPSFLRDYVERTIDQSPVYDGKIGAIEVNLWRGAYALKDVQLNKTTSNVPVPWFAAPRVELAVDWAALWHGRLVGTVVMERPELNFVDAPTQAGDQSGEAGPWLEMLRDLHPLKINRTEIRDGSVHFRAFQTDPPVDMYLSQVNATIGNLTNIYDETTPLVSTVEATALAMDHARVEMEMKLDPFSYRPTFQVALRLLGLDVTKTNDLTRAYAGFDFEKGWFDLVIELTAVEGQLAGYVKPMYRNVQIFSLTKDVPEDNLLMVFWEMLVGGVTELLENQPRDQFATKIPIRGDLAGPQTAMLTAVGNVLRNAFVRAYLPQLEGVAPAVSTVEFGKAEAVEPLTPDLPNKPAGAGGSGGGEGGRNKEEERH